MSKYAKLRPVIPSRTSLTRICFDGSNNPSARTAAAARRRAGGERGNSGDTSHASFGPIRMVALGVPSTKSAGIGGLTQILCWAKLISRLASAPHVIVSRVPAELRVEYQLR